MYLELSCLNSGTDFLITRSGLGEGRPSVLEAEAQRCGLTAICGHFSGERRK